MRTELSILYINILLMMLKRSYCVDYAVYGVGLSEALLESEAEGKMDVETCK